MIAGPGRFGFDCTNVRSGSELALRQQTLLPLADLNPQSPHVREGGRSGKAWRSGQCPSRARSEMKNITCIEDLRELARAIGLASFSRLDASSARPPVEPGCPVWVISCRGSHKAGCPLYPRKLPRLSTAGASALGQKRTHALQQLGYARSFWIKKKNTLRIVERPRLEARKKRLTK